MVLDDLKDKLRSTFADRLVSIVLYGSAALGSEQDEFSDYNVLCVLREVGVQELTDAEPIVRWWREKGYPAPVLLSRDEVLTSTDCFAMEFADMRMQRRILHGEDVIAGIEVDTRFYRARVEYEARAKLLRLRQRGAGVMHDKELLLRLMADSLSTFAVIMRHALMLAGGDAEFEKARVIQAAATRFAFDAKPFLDILEFRQKRKRSKDFDVTALFGSYVGQIQQLVLAIDRL